MRDNQESDRRRRKEGVRLAIVSAAFVLLGLTFGDRMSLFAAAFFGVGVVIGTLMALGYWPKEPIPGGKLTIDDEGVTRTDRKLREHVAWDNIERVRIMTTDQGPRTEDVFFILDGKSGEGCMVPHELAVDGGLLEALQARLPGLDNGAVIDAMTSIQNKVFTIWEAQAASQESQ